MKKTKSIVGLPIISISSAEEIGKVNNLIVNASKGTVDYILIETGEKTISSVVIATKDIIGVGEYAATIENETVMKDISSISDAVQLLQKNVHIKNTNILTKKGDLIGKSGDFYVNEENFNIEGIEFIEGKDETANKIIPRKDVITFGKALIIVTEDAKSNLVETERSLNQEEGNRFFHKPEERVRGIDTTTALEGDEKKNSKPEAEETWTEIWNEKIEIPHEDIDDSEKIEIPYEMSNDSEKTEIPYEGSDDSEKIEIPYEISNDSEEILAVQSDGQDPLLELNFNEVILDDFDTLQIQPQSRGEDGFFYIDSEDDGLGLDPDDELLQNHEMLDFEDEDFEVEQFGLEMLTPVQAQEIPRIDVLQDIPMDNMMSFEDLDGLEDMESLQMVETLELEKDEPLSGILDMDFAFSLKEEDEEKMQQELINKVLRSMDSEESTSKASDSATEEFHPNAFEQKQIQYLSGKILTKDIQIEDELLGKMGTMITPALIHDCKKKGKLIELIMNCK